MGKNLRPAGVQPVAHEVSILEGNLQQSRFGELKKGWRSLVGCTLGASIGTMGIYVYTSGAFMAALVPEQVYTRTQLSLALMLLTIVVALMAPFVGWAIDRFGPVRIILLSIVGEALGFFLLGASTSSFGAYLALVALLAFLGIGTTPPGFARIITTRFHLARGLALGIVFSGIGLMAIGGPLWATWIISTWGWRVGYFAISAAVLVLGGLGLLLVGAERPSPASVQPRVLASSWQSIRQRLFWVICVAFMLPALFGVGYVMHMISIMRERGFSPADAAQAQALIGAAVLVGRLGSGAALDSFRATQVAAITFTVSALGCLLLLSSAPVAVAVAAIMIGLSIGAELDILAYVISRQFGLENFGRLYGIAYGLLCIAGGASGVLISLMAEAQGYTLALVISAIGSFAGALFVLSIPEPPATNIARLVR